MKKTILLFIAVLQFAITYSQEINYKKSYKEAIALAAKQKKPIFILLNPPQSTVTKSILQSVFISGIEAKEVVAFYNKKFISFQAAINDSAAKEIRILLHPVDFPAYIFMDSNAKLIYKKSGNTAAPNMYMNMAQEALKRIASGQTIGYFEELDKKGTINVDQLKAYIKLNQEMGLFDNSKLINEYVDLIPIKSLDNYEEVLFILQAGPYITSKAYKLCHTNQKLYDSIYKHESAIIRGDINKHIIANSVLEAIKNKDMALAQAAANYSGATWGSDYRSAGRTSGYSMLVYYKAVKDTASYFRQASSYYDNYFLNVSADSAKKLQAIAILRLRESTSTRQKAELKRDTTDKDNTKKYPLVVTTIGNIPPNSVATSLNNAAYDFYLMGTHNTNYLVKALIWCRRAIELQPIHSYYDTMAHIMYRLALYDEAQLNQQKAIDLARKVPASPQTLTKLAAELSKMKDRSLD